MKIRISARWSYIGMGLALLFALTDATAGGYFQGNECWAGGYFGIFFGAGDGNTHESFNDTETSRSITNVPAVDLVAQLDATERGFGKLKGDISGSVSDLFLGYNFHPRCSRFVFGAQLEGTVFSDITLKSIGNRIVHRDEISNRNEAGVVEISTESFDGTFTFEHADELRSIVSLLGRAGFLITPCTLVYGLAAATEGNFVLPAHGEDQLGGRKGKWDLGYTIGGGLEYKFNQNWSARAEYRFVHFDLDRNQSTFEVNAATTEDFTSVSESNFRRHFSNDIDFNLGVISIVYRFNPGCCCW